MNFIRKILKKDSKKNTAPTNDNEGVQNLPQETKQIPSQDKATTGQENVQAVPTANNDMSQETVTTTVIQAKIEEHSNDGVVVTEELTAVVTTVPAPAQNNPSEVDTAKKEQLEQLLEKQKPRESLVEQGILEQSNVADSLQSNKKELERHMASDKVDQGLRKRHSKEELSQCGLIKDGLQSALHSLEQEQKKDKLNHKLADRPTTEELEAQHILETEESLAAKEQRRASAVEVIEEQIQKQKNQKS